MCVCVKPCSYGLLHTLIHMQGGQAGYIVALSAKLVMYLRIWKWDATITYLRFNFLLSVSTKLNNTVHRLFLAFELAAKAHCGNCQGLMHFWHHPESRSIVSF